MHFGLRNHTCKVTSWGSEQRARVKLSGSMVRGGVPPARHVQGDEDEWSDEPQALRPSTPPAPPLLAELPRARITDSDMAALYPSMRSLSSAELPQPMQLPCSPSPSRSPRAWHSTLTSAPASLSSSSAAAAHEASASGTHEPTSLQAACLGVVGRHLQVYIEQLGPDALSWLPPDMKAALLAVAR